MKLEGSHRIDAPREVVWEALLDPDVIAETLPGCENLERIGDHEYRAPIRIGVGPVEGKFDGRFALSNLNRPESYHLDMNGKGPTGFMEGEGDIRLEEDGEGTILHYEMTAQVGGRVASVGQRLVKSTANMVTRKGLERLDRQIEARQGRA